MHDTAPILTVPEPLAAVDLTMADGAVIRMRQHGNPDGPRVALSHGNGLAIDAYFPFWDLLRPDYEVIVFDVRNHGQNPYHGREGHYWPNFGRDLEAVFDGIQKNFGTKRTAGLFHSLSSVAATHHTLTEGRRWDPLILVDMPIMPPEGHPLVQAEHNHMQIMSALAARRPERYATPDAFARQLAARRNFRRWMPGAYELFARATLREDKQKGDWALACPRDLEAFVFASNLNDTLWPRMAQIEAPVLLIGADPEGDERSGPALLTRALAKDQGLDYVMIPDTTHFLQIEKPGEVFAAADAVLHRKGRAGPGSEVSTP
ncbi:MAG: alpha/beta hydrolase [Pseudomonadota bacterium]